MKCQLGTEGVGGRTQRCGFLLGIQEMATHYGTAIVPTCVRKPRDKAKVEVAVQVVERWVLARLRHRRFFSLGELNAAIRELTNELNTRTMRRTNLDRLGEFPELSLWTSDGNLRIYLLAP